MALSFGEQSARLGLHEDAARLFDLSGDDARLTGYLSAHAQKTAPPPKQGQQSEPSSSSSPSPKHEALIQTEEEEAEDGAAGVEAAAAERLRALASAREAGGGAGGTVVGGPAATGSGAAAAGNATAGIFRRSTLLAGVSRFPQVCGRKACLCCLFWAGACWMCRRKNDGAQWTAVV